MADKQVFVVVLTVRGSVLDYLDGVPLNSRTLSNTLELFLTGMELKGDCETIKAIFSGNTED